MTPQPIDNYRLTSLEEPTDEMLAQLMHEAAEEARESNREATERFFAPFLPPATVDCRRGAFILACFFHLHLRF